MPEGDTIHRTAQTLRRALVGGEVTHVATTVGQVRRLGVERLIGQRVSEVEARGKHLLMWFTPGRIPADRLAGAGPSPGQNPAHGPAGAGPSPGKFALHSHMRMSGSWHLYRHGERWGRPQHRARFELHTGEWVAVCFSAPVIELLSERQVATHRSLAALGPDALAEEPDLADARRRLDDRADWTIGEALLDQRMLAGIGNVYKNEILFIHGLDPWLHVSHLDGVTRDALLETAVRLMRENTGRGRGRRVTTGDRSAGAAGLHVYGRDRRPCPRCQRPIAVARQGEQGRLTYWCRACQGPGIGG